MIKHSNRAKRPTQYLPLQLIVRCFLSFFCPIDQTRSYHNFPSNSFIPKTRKCSTNPISTQIISPCINCSVGCYNSWWRILCLYSSLYIIINALGRGFINATIHKTNTVKNIIMSFYIQHFPSQPTKCKISTLLCSEA